MRCRLDRLVLGAALLLGAAPASAFSSLTCFDVADPTPRSKVQATVDGPMGSLTCIVKTPARKACVFAGTTAATPLPAAGGGAGQSFLCYRARCTPAAARADAVGDAFGARVIRLRAAQLVCVPASLQPVTTTTITPTPATTTTAPTGCRFANGECTGSCGPGMKCGAAVGTASCECRSVSCGEADAPECNGACPEPSDACIFSITGCSCVHVP
ncbi:MAG TPA: hypothetical protein VKW76_06995 [Candidatus Binatia bacterium]|nr:hypothetical protein [Candidatus Binatia bacterium]